MPAHAQSVEAETLFAEGEKLMAAGKLGEACDAFAASNRIEARAGTLINLGLCQEKREKFASAWIAFRDALTRVKDPVKKQFATEHAAALEARFSSLTIELPTGKVDGLVVTRDGQPVDAALFGRAIPVDGGKHTVVANAPGRKTWTGDVQIANERDRSTVLIPALVLDASVPARPVREVPDKTHHTAALIFGSIGAAGLGFGIYGAVTARGFDHDAKDLCPDQSMPCAMASRANQLLDKRDTRALVANIGFGVAAAGAIAATIAILTGHASPDSDIAVTPRGDGATVQVRFAW
jgi:hypothetical protein